MKNSMKVFAAAGIALLCVSPASAQESGYLSAEVLKQVKTIRDLSCLWRRYHGLRQIFLAIAKSGRDSVPSSTRKGNAEEQQA